MPNTRRVPVSAQYLPKRPDTHLYRSKRVRGFSLAALLRTSVDASPESGDAWARSGLGAAQPPGLSHALRPGISTRVSCSGSLRAESFVGLFDGAQLRSTVFEAGDAARADALESPGLFHGSRAGIINMSWLGRVRG